MRGGVEGVQHALSGVAGWARSAWKRIRAWRRLRFTAGGLMFTAGACAVGFAAVSTGNNLLYLLLGAMLGFIAVSGWTSERMIRDLEVVRSTPTGVTVGQEVPIRYRVRSLRRRLPTLALEIGEQGLPETAFVSRLAPGATTTVRSHNRFVRRGTYPLDAVTLSTGFPFGLFVKERDLSMPGELVIWPRADRPVRRPRPEGGPARRRALSASGVPGARGEYRAMHEYRPGDDPRDIHWKTSARLAVPVVREYDGDAGDELWICLDTDGPSGDEAEAAVEIAASLASRAAREGRPFGVVAGATVLPPASGPAHLERALDLLARVDFRPGGPAPALPVDPSRCVLVSLDGRDADRFADSFSAAAT